MNRTTTWLLIALAGLAFFGGGVVVFNQTRGLRNNNPGNIRHGSDWQGLAAVQSDPSFATFVSPEYGIRAMAKLLQNYQTVYGLNTVRQIISRWAPPTENDTGSYVNHVAELLGVHPDQSISVASALPVLIPAIVRHENGVQPYSAGTIAKGIALV